MFFQVEALSFPAKRKLNDELFKICFEIPWFFLWRPESFWFFSWKPAGGYGPPTLPLAISCRATTAPRGKIQIWKK